MLAYLKAETLGIYLLSFFTYIFVCPKATVSTSRRDAGEEGGSTRVCVYMGQNKE